MGIIMNNIKLTIEYDGTNYHGWQIQPNAITIQEKVEQALNKLTGEEIRITGSGRTDSGVHSYGQVANFKTASTIPADKFKFALNSILPKDIVIKNSEEVKLDFNARFNSKEKTYLYRLYNSESPTAIMKDRVWQIKEKIDIEKIKVAADCLIGEHNFKSFCASGSSVDCFVRKIYSVEFRIIDEVLEVYIKGNGFLYNMVRIIIGTLVEVGKGKITVEDLKKIIKSQNRKNAGKTAPAQGLYLYKVKY